MVLWQFWLCTRSHLAQTEHLSAQTYQMQRTFLLLSIILIQAEKSPIMPKNK